MGVGLIVRVQRLGVSTFPGGHGISAVRLFLEVWELNGRRVLLGGLG